MAACRPPTPTAFAAPYGCLCEDAISRRGFKLVRIWSDFPSSRIKVPNSCEFGPFATDVYDNANDVDTDACLVGCIAAKCGDGLVQAGVEDCDDANMSDLDPCTNACKAAACDDGIRSGDESDVDCGGGCPACPVGDACATSKDCTSKFCNVGTCEVPRSCQQIKTADPMAPDGVYTIDPDGMGNGASISAYCDMTTDGGGWTMVFKLSSGVAGDANNLWTGAALNESDPALLDQQHHGHRVDRLGDRGQQVPSGTGDPGCADRCRTAGRWPPLFRGGPWYDPRLGEGAFR